MLNEKPTSEQCVKTTETYVHARAAAGLQQNLGRIVVAVARGPVQGAPPEVLGEVWVDAVVVQQCGYDLVHVLVRGLHERREAHGVAQIDVDFRVPFCDLMSESSMKVVKTGTESKADEASSRSIWGMN